MDARLTIRAVRPAEPEDGWFPLPEVSYDLKPGLLQGYRELQVFQTGSEIKK